MEVTQSRAEDAPLKSYAYKVGLKGAIIGGAFVLGSLAISKDFLGDNIEWHLFGASDPFVVPNILIKLIWWTCFLLGVSTLLMSRLPAQSIMLERDGIMVPNLLTRKYTKVLWGDVIRVDVSKHALAISSRAESASIAKLGMRDAEWADLQRELAARAPFSPTAHKAG